ncbi:hypothetical protein BDN70DRAFT_879999 [Pholiota conissans]|uniref:Uncharacterized protein n=1 Tax=Pholiota conissans TaxID=109636 RepID=A0A9P5YZL1_9AGAR|nr:hypothetical protein BDN70DRAFT_879999 [Pholiota conissans]
MVGVVDGGPSFISSHSADVILSDIRPIKLKPEALRAINVLLDEFLSKILSTSGSLSPDKLRASLLSILPTSLGKEALLEAEVELRAYWERTEGKAAIDDDSRTFHLQWAFSLLRLKCEAYSTLNEQDEDPNAESRINETFGKVHPHPPKDALLDPAALYLTAILESMCEHILSNVGRVAARDSSRTNATVNDLFVALCEDDSIYGLFRTMKVYEQIESMAKSPKPRRSRSFSRSERHSMSRTSSPQQELTLVQSPTGSRSRQSSEGQLPGIQPTASSGARASFEKSKAIRMFTNSKNPSEADTQSSHKRSASLRSESSRALLDDDISNPAEDAEMLREFDDLMRSASTMKVSLTPDRLRTMEVYKQEKDQRTARRPGTQLVSKPEPDLLPLSRTNIQKSAPRHVDAIVEDDDEEKETPSPKGRARQASVATPPTLSSVVPPVPSRSRSVSTSASLPSAPIRKPSRNASITAAPSSFTPQTHPLPPNDMIQSRDFRKAPNNNGFPQRTRVKQRNRESMDLDDIMNGSDGEEEEVSSPPVRPQPQPRSPSTPKRHTPAPAVSAKTRELMDFLAEGPPEPPVSRAAKDMIDFMAEGPPDYKPNAQDSSKPKGAGRLQRMISKLNLGNAEKVKVSPDQPRTIQPIIPPTPPRPPIIHPHASYTNLSSLANRPIPPRPPRPISPPSSPSQSHESSDENKSLRNPTRKPYQDTNIPRNSPTSERPVIERLVPSASPSPVTTPTIHSRDVPERNVYRQQSPTHVHGNGNGSIKSERTRTPVKETTSDAHIAHISTPIRTTSNPPVRKPVPSVVPVVAPVVAPPQPAAPVISENDVRDMQRLLASATTADECRLIFDMYLTRNGIPKVPKAQVAPYPSPAPSVVKHAPSTATDPSLEGSLVELFLGDLIASDVAPEIPQPIPVPINGLPGDATNDFIENAGILPEKPSIPIQLPIRA